MNFFISLATMYKIFVEASRLFLLGGAFQHNISRTANCITVFRKYDKKQNVLSFWTKDLNGSRRRHLSKIMLPEVPQSREHCLKMIDRSQDIKVSCTCQDFRYRRAYKATMLNYNEPSIIERRPARKTNPLNRGTVCKHLYHILKNIRTILPTKISFD